MKFHKTLVFILISFVLSACAAGNSGNISDVGNETAKTQDIKKTDESDGSGVGKETSEETVSGISKSADLAGSDNQDDSDITSQLSDEELLNMNLYGPGGTALADEITPMERYGLTEEEITAMSWLEYMRLPLRDFIIKDEKTVEYRGDIYKKKSYVKAILCIGVDTHDDLSLQKKFGERPLADAVFVIAHDTARNKLSVLMIPRDTMIECDCYDPETDEKYGEEVLHITQAFSERKNSVDGVKNVKTAVERLLPGVSIDKYCAVNLSVIAGAVDAVDSVKVTVPNEELVNFDPSWTLGSDITLTSENAEKFLRYRTLEKESGGIGPVLRMMQHRQFMLGFSEAIKKKSRSDSNVVLNLYNIAEDHMITDMKKDEILKIGMDTLTSSFDDSNIVSLSGMEEAYEYTQVYTDYEQAIPQILGLFYEKK